MARLERSIDALTAPPPSTSTHERRYYSSRMHALARRLAGGAASLGGGVSGPLGPLRYFAVINGNQVRVGNVLEFKGKLVVVRRAQAVKPGKGGAFNQVELRDIRTGTKYHERLRASESVERVRLDDEEEYDFLYSEGDKLVLMHKADFTQIEVPREMLGEAEHKFLEEGLALRVQSYEGQPLIVRLPKHMTVEVAETERFSKGNQANPTFKPATLANGAVIKVPPFVEIGEKVVLDTEEMEYVSRAT